MENGFSGDCGSRLTRPALCVVLCLLNSSKDICARRPCALSIRPPVTKMKSCHGRRTPDLTLSTSHSGLTTFKCLNSRTLAGVREQVMT